MEPEGSLSCSLEPTTELYIEPDESSRQLHNISLTFILILSLIYFVSQVICSFQFIQLKLCIHFSSPHDYVLRLLYILTQIDEKAKS